MCFLLTYSFSLFLADPFSTRSFPSSWRVDVDRRAAPNARLHSHLALQSPAPSSDRRLPRHRPDRSRPSSSPLVPAPFPLPLFPPTRTTRAKSRARQLTPPTPSVWRQSPLSVISPEAFSPQSRARHLLFFSHITLASFLAVCWSYEQRICYSFLVLSIIFPLKSNYAYILICEAE